VVSPWTGTEKAIRTVWAGYLQKLSLSDRFEEAKTSNYMEVLKRILVDSLLG
jgi:hypothetical protein